MTEIPVGLIGFGVAARVFHAPVIEAVEGLKLAAVVERHGETAARTYPGVRSYRDADSLLASGCVRLVVIATPNATHYEIARAALATGHDVVVDKPFTLTSDEALELEHLAEEKGRLLSVFHNRRWDGDFLTVRGLIESGDLGRVVRFESRFDRYRPQRRPKAWREAEGPGGGLLMDLGPHLVDQALLLFGEPEAVAADVRIERDGAVTDDAFDLVLHYPRLRVFLGASMLACSPGPRFLVHGVQGSFVKYGLDPQEAALRAGVRPGVEGWGEEPESAWGTLAAGSPDGSVGQRKVSTEPGDYRRYYENVRDALNGSARLAVTVRDGFRVIRLLELARESARRHAAVECELGP